MTFPGRADPAGHECVWLLVEKRGAFFVAQGIILKFRIKQKHPTESRVLFTISQLKKLSQNQPDVFIRIRKICYLGIVLSLLRGTS